MSAVWGDGVAGECSPNVNNFSLANVPNTAGPAPAQSRIYVSAEAVSGSGVTGASKTLTITPEFFY
jgi:hypothetical protein